MYLFFSAMAVGFSGAMMPGSLLTYTLHQAMQSGLRAGFFIAIGHAILELALVLLIFLGFGVILQSDAAQITISLVGGILLIVMGLQMLKEAFKDKIRVDMTAPQRKANTLRLVASGAFISVINPTFLLWWAVVGLGFILQSYHSLGAAGVCIYYLGHISADFIWYVSISAVIGKTRKFIKKQPYRIVIAALGALLIFFGVKFLFGIAAYL